jgi:hypothetical protein
MKKFIAILLALAFAALANIALAGTGMPLMKGFKSTTELASLVEKSLATDSTGNKVLDPVRCKKSGSCATAYDYFFGIKSMHPNVQLNEISELPRYLRSLKKNPAPAGEWQVSRLLVKGGSHKYDATGWHRAFFKGEAVWFDLGTGEPILAGDCGNIVGVLVQPIPPKVRTPIEKNKCVELAFTAPVGGYVRWGDATTNGPLPPDECNAQRQDDGLWTSWYGECDICFPAIDYIHGILGDSALIPHKYLYPVTAKKQTLRFSTSVWNTVVYICLEDANGVRTCGVYMRPQDWHGRFHVDIPDTLWVSAGDCPH